MALARHYLAQGRRGKAINWANRAVNCRDATVNIRSEAAGMERRLKWALHDRGFGVVDIRVIPSGATVRIDGQLFRPAGSGFRVWLPSGSHELSVRKARFRNVTRIITAKPGESRRVNVKLVFADPPVVRFSVKPVNAEVWLARDFLGFSAGRRYSLPVGKSLIELRAPGHISWVRTLELRAGERRTIEVHLERAATRNRKRITASDVPRRLTPIELANRGERHRLGRRPGPRRAFRKAYHGSGEAPAEAPSSSRPNWRKLGKSGAAPNMEAPPPSNEPPPEVSLPDDGSDAGAEPGFGGEVSAGGLSDVSKGWLYTGVGIALLAGGVGGSLYGVAQANEANDLPLGSGRYAEYYGSAANLTYAGYGTAGVGLASLVVGGLYLFSEDGLDDAGRGWFLAGAGAVTGLAGTWLLTNAVATAKAANELAPQHYAYARRFDGAERNWLVGVVAAGLGGAVALGGTWLALTADDGADVSAQTDVGRWWARVSLLPMFSLGDAASTGGGGLQGVGFRLRW